MKVILLQGVVYRRIKLKKIEISQELLYDLWTINNKTLLEIAKELGVSDTTVKKRIKEYKLVRAFHSKEWLYEHHVKKGLTIRKMAEIAHCSVDAVSNGMKRLDIPINIYQSNQVKRKYHVNTTFFEEINSEEKAYWFGFLMADGYVSDEVITIGLSRKDEQHIQSFLNTIESNTPIVRYNSDAGIKGSKHEMSKVTVCSVRLARSLNKLGLKSPKSLQEFLPSLPDELYSPFIRGYYDGDGGYHYHQNAKGKWKIKVSILGGKRMCQSIKEHALKQGITLCVYQKNNHLYEVAGSHHQAQNFLEYLYMDATIFLPRKHQKFLQSPIKR